MYPVQLEDRIHWITATLFKNAYKARSLPAFGKSDHAAIFLTPEYKQRLAQEPPVKREVTRWSSHSEAMLQAALDDVDWDMFRASSSDVSEFTDVAVSFVNTLTEQATETITVRTFPNQKPWVDRTIRDAVNKRTAAYNEALLSGNMSVYKASCYALRRAVSAAKHRYKERIESHFQLNDSRRMWQGLRTICAFGNKSSAEVSADPSLADELNTSVWYGNSSSQDCKALQRVVRLAERISGSALPSLQDIYLKRCRSRAVKIIKDSNHPGNCLFTLLPSGKCFRCMMAKTERLRRSFFPKAIRLLNSTQPLNII